MSYSFLPPPEHQTTQVTLACISQLLKEWHDPPRMAEHNVGWVRHLAKCTISNIIPSRLCLTLIVQGEKYLHPAHALPGEYPNVSPVVFTRGSLILFPPEERIVCTNCPAPHAPYLAFTISFAEETLLRLKTRLPQQREQHDGDVPRIFQSILLFAECCAENPDPALSMLQQEHILYLLWRNGILYFPAQHSLVCAIRAMVEEAPDTPWSSRRIAESLHMSERTLRRRLLETGHHCADIIRISRLHVGLVLLQRGDLRVSEVAARCGYDSPSRFAARFREQFGITPAAILHTSPPDN